jgi:hypothetical protein
MIYLSRMVCPDCQVRNGLADERVHQSRETYEPSRQTKAHKAQWQKQLASEEFKRQKVKQIIKMSTWHVSLTRRPSMGLINVECFGLPKHHN